MDNKEFIRKSIKLCEQYKELYKEGILGVDTTSAHMDSNGFFARFNKSECQKDYHSEPYPTRYSIIKNGITFLCLTEETWEEQDGTIKE